MLAGWAVPAKQVSVSRDPISHVSSITFRSDGDQETHVSHTGASPVLQGTHRPIVSVSTKHSADRGRGAHRAPPAASGRNQEAAGRPSVLPCSSPATFLSCSGPFLSSLSVRPRRMQVPRGGGPGSGLPLRDWVPQSPGHVTKAKSP